MRLRPALFLFLAAGGALAQDWPLRSGDVPLTRTEIATRIAGHTLTFHDDGQLKFSVGGAYSYSYADPGGTAFGRFRVMDAGEICIA